MNKLFNRKIQRRSKSVDEDCFGCENGKSVQCVRDPSGFVPCVAPAKKDDNEGNNQGVKNNGEKTAE